MKEAIVRITNAEKYYNRSKSNELHVMNHVNLELPASGMVAVFGKSGCGKTTLLNAIGGLDKLASGTIELFGRNIREDTDTLRNQYIGYIFQNYNLRVTETVYENVAVALRLCGVVDEVVIATRVMAALENVDMAKYRDRTPDTLSGGQQQRVAIARALVKNPAIILADEPTGNLDETNTVMVMDILKEISRTHLVILVTHEANLVDHYCDRVIEIVDGRINSQRENSEANGYVQRNKNDIYLGELTRTETSTPGVTVEYFGEATDAITLRIVHVGGKIYLQTDHPGVKLLDEGSEIKLREGVFEEARRENNAVNGRRLDMSALTEPLEGKHYGRLYGMKNAMLAAWRENFSQRKKKGKRLLRVCLFMLAVVMVFMTATAGASIHNYADLRKTHNDRLYYVAIDPELDYSALNAAIGTEGMDYARIIGSPLYDSDNLTFNSAAFMTAESVSIGTDAQAQSIRHAEALPLVAGTMDLESSSDIVITTAVADAMLKGSTVSYLNEYSDLVGMISQNSYYSMGNIHLRIVGVVESDEIFYYMNELQLAKHILDSYFWMPIAPISSVDTDLGLSIEPGQIICLDNGYLYTSVRPDDTLTILGKTFTVAASIKAYFDDADYRDFLQRSYGFELGTMPTDEGSMYEWLIEDYFRYLPMYYQQMLAARSPYEDVSFDEWAVAERAYLPALASIMDIDPILLCGSDRYHKEFGRYPTADELYAYLADETVSEAIQDGLDDPIILQAYDNYVDQRYYSDYSKEYAVIVTDEDYIALASSVGKTDDELGFSVFDVYHFSGEEESYYSNYLMIRSSDTAATERFLLGHYGDSIVMTPAEIFETRLAEIRTAVLIAGVSVLAIVVLMCLCVYFIMRSSFMSRVREVGILRAIGVTRKNLVFRFAVETALLILLTMVFGYLLSAWFIASLADAALFSTVFYFPVWLGAALLIVICAAALLFGILPALILLRRTPSEILSKYDI